MNKKLIGILISLIGIGLMGFEAGRNSKNDEHHLQLTFIGLFIVFIGVFIVSFFKEQKPKK